MRCRQSMINERERCLKALNATRDEMAGQLGGGMPMRLYLDESMLLGQLKALDFALASDDGGWPHDAWFTFIDARADAVRSMIKAGKSYPVIVETLHLTEIEARLIVKVDKPDGNNN